MYVFHSDPGHGWLEVKRQELKDLGILNEISQYSYQKGDTVYLEEDCDAALFTIAKEKAGQKIERKDIVESYKENTPIRNYQSFC